MLSFDKTEEEARLNLSSTASTPLKITFPLKNLFLLVQASSNLSITRLNFAFYFQVQQEISIPDKNSVSSHLLSDTKTKIHLDVFKT